MRVAAVSVLAVMLLAAVAARAASSGVALADAAAIDWQPLGDGLRIARTETTVAQFRDFVDASGMRTAAEPRGGGEVYEDGWVRRPGWTWRTPFGGGRAATDAEPAVHVTFGEAQAFCRWAGGRLPRDAEWLRAAYTEQRPVPPPAFEAGRTYPFPTGHTPAGAQCLDDCGPAAAARAVAHGARLWRSHGHASAGATPAGVNGLHDMGGNVWEWVDDPADGSADAPRATRGGSWWYGQAPMRADHRQSKPADTAAVYIGFRCVSAP